MLRDSKLSPTFAALAIQFAKSFGFDSRLFGVRFLLFYFYKDVVYHYFNFIKKQLSRLFGLHAESLRKFQCAKGTIKTIETTTNLKNCIVFQFHKGTIKTCDVLLVLFLAVISIP